MEKSFVFCFLNRVKKTKWQSNQNNSKIYCSNSKTLLYEWFNNHFKGRCLPISLSKNPPSVWVCVRVWMRVCACVSLPSIYTRCYPVLAPRVCLLLPMYPKGLWNFSVKETQAHHFSRVDCNIRDVQHHLLLHLFFYQQKGKVNSSHSCRSVITRHTLGFPFLPRLWVVMIVNLLHLVAAETELNYIESSIWVELKFHKLLIGGCARLFSSSFFRATIKIEKAQIQPIQQWVTQTKKPCWINHVTSDSQINLLWLDLVC